jgi:multimeric flavodoxin WrbA
MSRKIVILKGSPRGKGNSAALADRLAAGAMEAGAQVESVCLHGMDIRPCDACDLCREQRQGCVIQDDMHSLYPRTSLKGDEIILSFISRQVAERHRDKINALVE